MVVDMLPDELRTYRIKIQMIASRSMIFFRFSILISFGKKAWEVYQFSSDKDADPVWRPPMVYVSDSQVYAWKQLWSS